MGATRGLNPGPLASNASGVTLSENHTTRPAALVIGCSSQSEMQLISDR